jgi:ribosomal-protein-serine acetyltransferase
MCRIELSGQRALRLLTEADAAELHAAIEANREHLSRWLPWAAEQTIAGTGAFLRSGREQLARNDGYQAAIVARQPGEPIVGVIGFHNVSWTHRHTGIGYWLVASEQGRGTVTLAVKALMRQVFEQWQLHRLEIRAAVGNARSRSVPERLGFVDEGVLREVERVGDRYLDHVVYAMLAEQWRVRASAVLA